MRTGSVPSLRSMVSVSGEYSAIPLNDLASVRKSLISGTENATFSPPGPLMDCRR